MLTLRIPNRQANLKTNAITLTLLIQYFMLINYATIMKHLIQPGNLPQPWQKPIAQARLKSSPADFIVEEVMTVDLSGQGEHLWLKVQKCGMNTDFGISISKMGGHSKTRRGIFRAKRPPCGDDTMV